MINKGSQEIELETDSRVTIQADDTIKVYGLRNGQVVAVLGPTSTTARTVVLDGTGDLDTIRVVAVDDTIWSYTVKPLAKRKEKPDPKSLTIPVLASPLTLQEQIQMYVQGALSGQAGLNGRETFEESMDFEMEDEVQWTSPYEISDMVEEFPNGVPEASARDERKPDRPADSERTGDKNGEPVQQSVRSDAVEVPESGVQGSEVRASNG